MKRLAVFVEGATDQAFMERLIAEVVGHNQVVINVTNSFCTGAPWSITASTYTAQQDDRRFYVLIINCGTDERIVTAINERYDGLVSAGYDIVIGMRDVLGAGVNANQLRHNLRQYLAQGSLRIEIVLAVMELEAWFVGEVTHFARIDSRLTNQFILRERGVDITSIVVEAIRHPARELDQIYRLVGRRYRKGKYKSRQTLGKIDYDEIYVNVADRAPALRELCEQLDEFAT